MEAAKSTILVADDQPTVLGMIRLVLQNAGFEVLTAHDGREGLVVAQAHEGPIHLLLSDVMMPGMDRPELARQLKAARAGLHVVMISGYSQHVLKLDSGWHFLQKPFRPAELVTAVQAALAAPLVKRSGQA